VLNKAIASNDEANDKSYSKNPDALAAYDKGIDYFKTSAYNEAIPWFEKAVQTDASFAFAWDNLGICYRRTGKLDKAEAAYKSSLKADPKGRTALQNLAVVYQLQKRDDEAIATYKNISDYYPDDPEIYYGIALVYVNNKKDLENGLQNMCKAYNLYIKMQSPYRSDAEKVINAIYGQLKKENKEDVFKRILKENNISAN
ncbi:MAG TPA: tetratricopeptide repeat protein, partial [Flavisolibacter sp.]|nr:tetratricopeptide repeat protein [Flavisolibacter sp.]